MGGLPGFDAWLKSNDLTGVAFTKPGCPPLLGVWRQDLGPKHGCDEYNDKVLAFIESRRDVKTVILAARWALATEGSRPLGEEGSPAILAVSGRNAPIATDNAGIFEEGLSRLVGELDAANQNILILLGVPEIGFNVPDALLRQSFSGTKLPEPVTIADFENRNNRAISILVNVSGRFGAKLASISEIMCPDDCLIEKDGLPLYRDDDHLSISGALWVVPAVLNAHLATEFE